jgi:hypothetical protein
MPSPKDLARLEKRIQTLSEAFARLAKISPGDLLRIIRRPGWTRPAEFVFALAITDALISQAQTLEQLSTGLLNGSRAVLPTTGDSD